VIEPVKFGVVGIGGYGRSHLGAVADVEEDGLGRLDAVVVIDPENHVETLKGFRARGIRIFANIDELLKAGGVDVVTLPIGIHHHVPLTIQSLDAGYHVICEKPLTGAVQDAARLIAARDRTKRHVVIGYQHLYSPTIQQLKKAILDGRYGRVRSMRLKAGWPRPDTYYARNGWAARLKREGTWVLDSPINNALSHYVMNLLYLCGPAQAAPCGLRSVQAELYRARDIESLDTASMRAETDNGVTLTIAMSHVTAENFGPIMDIHCDKASVHWVTGHADVTYGDGRTETIDDGEERIRSLSFRNMIGAIRRGETVISTPEVARAQTLCINGAHESCPEIGTIPSAARKDVRRNDTRFVVVDGLDDLIHRSVDQGHLFSELGVAWAKESGAFGMAGYDYYPRREKPRA
jgi:predicted dehydrogenase